MIGGATLCVLMPATVVLASEAKQALLWGWGWVATTWGSP